MNCLKKTIKTKKKIKIKNNQTILAKSPGPGQLFLFLGGFFIFLRPGPIIIAQHLSYSEPCGCSKLKNRTESAGNVLVCVMCMYTGI